MSEQKVLTAADIAKINEGFHRCGWTTGAVKNPNPACGCMCGTVYNEKGEPILCHGPRHSGYVCKCFPKQPDGEPAASPEGQTHGGQIEDNTYVRMVRPVDRRILGSSEADLVPLPITDDRNQSEDRELEKLRDMADLVIATQSAQPEPQRLPWDMPTTDRRIYESISAMVPEERYPLEALTKKYIDMTAQAISDCDVLRERARAAEAELAALKQELTLWRSEHDPCPFALELEALKQSYDEMATVPTSDEINYLADVWRSHNQSASLQTQIYELVKEFLGRRAERVDDYGRRLLADAAKLEGK